MKVIYIDINADYSINSYDHDIIILIYYDHDHNTDQIIMNYKIMKVTTTSHDNGKHLYDHNYDGYTDRI